MMMMVGEIEFINLASSLSLSFSLSPFSLEKYSQSHHVTQKFFRGMRTLHKLRYRLNNRERDDFN
jgi:hypothetical protein